MKILTEPKNALLKQYQRLSNSKRALALYGRRPRHGRGVSTSAQSLALAACVMILEDLMLELMYHLPMQAEKVRDFVVTADMVRTREINWSLLEKAG